MVGGLSGWHHAEKVAARLISWRLEIRFSLSAASGVSVKQFASGFIVRKAACFRPSRVQLRPGLRRVAAFRTMFSPLAFPCSRPANQGGQNEEKNHENYHRRLAD